MCIAHDALLDCWKAGDYQNKTVRRQDLTAVFVSKFASRVKF
jgi:hypothetical protein